MFGETSKIDFNQIEMDLEKTILMLKKTRKCSSCYSIAKARECK
jgi:hypothetical protein